MKGSYKIVKRVIDIGLSLILLMLIGPLLFIILLINTLIFKKSFYYQERVGQHGNFFTIVKIKTMDDSGFVSSFHSFLRYTGIDEIPQLFNILKGDMSLVGPRPILTEYLVHLKEHELNRFSVKPGLTGYAQIMGRNKLNWEQKFNYDLDYIKNLSLYNDLLILIKTPYRVYKSCNLQAQSLIDERS